MSEQDKLSLCSEDMPSKRPNPNNSFITSCGYNNTFVSLKTANGIFITRPYAVGGQMVMSYKGL